jgi:hypothetical protein
VFSPLRNTRFVALLICGWKRNLLGALLNCHGVGHGALAVLLVRHCAVNKLMQSDATETLQAQDPVYERHWLYLFIGILKTGNNIDLTNEKNLI